MTRVAIAALLLSALIGEAAAQYGNTGIGRQQTCTTYCTGSGNGRVCTTTCS
jgi:hypothetical protein